METSQLSCKVTTQICCRMSLFRIHRCSLFTPLLSCSHCSPHSFHALHNHPNILGHLYKVHNSWNRVLCRAQFQCIHCKCCNSQWFRLCRPIINPNNKSFLIYSSKLTILNKFCLNQGMLHPNSNKIQECLYRNISSLQKLFRYLLHIHFGNLWRDGTIYCRVKSFL